MKVAYLLGVQATYTGKATHTTYRFDPWADVDPSDWPKMKQRTVTRGGCCGSVHRVLRVFGTEDEIRDGVVEVHWR